MSQRPADRNAHHWDAYWGGGGGREAAVTGDAPGDLFDDKWRNFFDRELPGRQSPRVIDLACGAGVVLDRAIAGAKTANCDGQSFYGVDYSYSAAARIGEKRALETIIPVCGVAASVSALPFGDGEFDVVVSQFGIEYAGIEAFGEAARILSPGGSAQFIIHYKGGGIDQECGQNRKVLEAILNSKIFETALSAVREDGSHLPPPLTEIIEGLRSNLDGQVNGARNMLARLLPDLTLLITRRRAYDPAEATAWLNGMHEEVRRYEGRMRAMNESALDQENVEKAKHAALEQGVQADEPEPLIVKDGKSPIAWRMRLKRTE